MKEISVVDAIALKSPTAAQRMPRFLIRYLERILHLEEMNRFLSEHEEVYGLDFTRAAVDFFELSIEIEGKENLKQEPRGVYASNHPLGGLDGVALLHIIGQAHGSVVNISNDFLLSVEQLQELLVPVNKLGSSREYFHRIDQAYASDVPFLIFPAGLCSRKFSFGIADLQWKKSFVKKARQFKRPIVPMGVTGQNSRFFYNLARLRKFFGIKFNIEMIYLVDEMMKQRTKTMRVLVSPPVSHEVFDGRFTDWQWAAKLRQHVYNMLQEGRVIPFNPDITVTLPDEQID